MTTLNLQEIGLRLKSLRTSHKLTIERLAELVGTSTSFIGLVEKGSSGISIDNLHKLSKIFTVTTDYILTGSMDKPDHQSKFAKLNSALFDYSEDELNFIVELSEFIKKRTSLKH